MAQRQTAKGQVIDRIRAWSCRRQLLGGATLDTRRGLALEPLAAALSAIDAVVAVYGSRPTAPLSIAARVGALDPATFIALEEERLALRMPAMRGSVHLVPTATAHLVAAATRGAFSAHHWRLRAGGVELADYEAMRPAVAAAARTPVTIAVLRETVGLSTVAADGIVSAMTFEGLLLRVGGRSLRTNAGTYVGTAAWLGVPLEEVDGDDALRFLAERYVRAFGPVRMEDLRWWAKVLPQRAAAALAAIAAVDIGDGLYLMADDVDSFAAASVLDGDVLDVLPVWDAYTMGYAPDGRARLGPPQLVDRMFDDGGNGLGLVLRDGVPILAWGSRAERRRLQVNHDAFVPLTKSVARRLTDRFGELATLLGLDDVELVAAARPLQPVGGKGNRARYR